MSSTVFTGIAPNLRPGAVLRAPEIRQALVALLDQGSIVDTYGGAAPHGGGAFSGKDPTKVDRSAAYAARYLAKNVVAAGLAKRCTIQLSYAIGVSRPLSVYVDTHGTGEVDENSLGRTLQEMMDLSPRGIREHLGLNKPIYARTTAYGHFGRTPDSTGGFSWEKTDLVDELKRAWHAVTAGEFRTGPFKHSFTTGIELTREWGKRDSYKVATDTGKVCQNGIGAASGYNCTSLFNPNPNDPWTGNITLANNPAETTVRTQSAYVFDTIELSPRWQINGGLRYDRYSASATTSANAQGVRSSFSRDDNLLNYQLGLVFKPAQNGSIYVAYGTSSTPSGSVAGQGADGSALTPDRSGNRGDVLAPEKNRAYELGTKWNVLDNKLALTAAIFRIETTNARIVLQDGTAAMAGNKRVDGFELGWSGALTNKWQVFGGYTYLKSELRNNGGSGSAFGVTNGTEFPNTPKSSFSLWTTYQPMPKFTLGGGAYYVSKVWGSANPANPKWVPAYWRFDAMASYRIDKHMNLQLNVQNLFDKKYYNQAYASHYASLAPGRAAILTLGIRY